MRGQSMLATVWLGVLSNRALHVQLCNPLRNLTNALIFVKFLAENSA